VHACSSADIILILVAQQEQAKKFDKTNALAQAHEAALAQKAAKPLLR
jgi:hypothetical protein